MSEEQPEAEDWFGEDVKNGVGNDFGINVDDTSTISNTPDTVEIWLVQMSFEACIFAYIGYTVQRMKVNAAIAPKKALVLLSLPVAACWPLTATW